ncbi:MAG: exosortase/archaeosortase family protein, partial [Pirellulales bacterium]
LNSSRETTSFLGVRGSTAAILLAAIFVWSYWPVLCELWQAWGREADYSHGYLVIPVALAFLWLRRGSCPSSQGGLSLGGISLGGLVLLAASSLVRLAGALWYVEALQGWSMLLWLAGACWMLGGFAMLRFSATAIGFLAFMIPLPFRAEGLLSLPLQRIATHFSCWILQCLGQPAIAEGNVVVINDTRLMVAEACSGLRIFISILAMAYAFCALLDRPKWIKVGLVLSVLPITLVTNSLRIVATGLTHQYVSSNAAHLFAHDLAGWLMLPVAGLLMYAVVLYFARLVVEVETVSARDLFRPSGPV